jgi:hypothetical protein
MQGIRRVTRIMPVGNITSEYRPGIFENIPILLTLAAMVTMPLHAQLVGV